MIATIVESLPAERGQIDAGEERFPAVLAAHMPPGARVEKPVHQRDAALADRILDILVRPGAEAIDGDSEAADPAFRHDASPCVAIQ